MMIFLSAVAVHASLRSFSVWNLSVCLIRLWLLRCWPGQWQIMSVASEVVLVVISWLRLY